MGAAEGAVVATAVGPNVVDGAEVGDDDGVSVGGTARYRATLAFGPMHSAVVSARK